MRKRMRSKILLCLTAILLFAFSIQVYANDSNALVNHEGTEGENSLMDEKELEKVNVEGKGSISVELTEGRKGTSREKVEFSCTKVGEISKGEYVMKDEFSASGIDLNAIESAKDMEEAAEKLAALDFSAEKVLLTDKDGKLCFQDLPVGVYFLEATNTAKYEKVTPFLISIPTFDEAEGEMNYDIKVIPKHEPEPGRITTDSPKRPGAPQTGLDSPILKYFAGALIIVLLLVALNVGTKKTKKKNEKTDKCNINILPFLVFGIRDEGTACIFKCRGKE